jgi:SAM-dependent methyltransferase
LPRARESGEALVARLGITKGLKVLDLGFGDGKTALPATRLGADALGVDIARNLVEAGNKSAKEQSLTNCKFREGDASNLHEFGDQKFDLVVSIFGTMFAPRPFEVAKEKSFPKTDLSNARLTGSNVDGVSVRGIKVNDGTKQQNLIIADPDRPDQPSITADDIEVAQFNLPAA